MSIPSSTPEGLTPEPIQARIQRLATRGIRPGLDTLRRVLADLGAPHLRAPSVLIAGTNGKGSTAALLASMLDAAGYRVGLFTSPHLDSFEEQIRLNGEPIAANDLVSIWDQVEAQAKISSPGRITAFEVLTAVAWIFFDQQDVDIAVCEVGMGGRFDSTNVAQPILSAVTSLGLDHGEFLGTSLAEVAQHKGGIFRPGRPALIGWMASAAGEELLAEQAATVSAKTHRIRHQVHHLSFAELSDGLQQVRFETDSGEYILQCPLRGEHQARNLALAVRAAEELVAMGWDRLRPRAIRQGAANCEWPGRLESLRVLGQDILLDAAHNVEAATALLRYLEVLGAPFELFFGTLIDKDAVGILTPLRNADRIWLSRPSGARAWDPEAFVQSQTVVPKASLQPPDDIERALTRALKATQHRLVVTGSLRFVSEVRRCLFKHFEPDVPKGGTGSQTMDPT